MAEGKVKGVVDMVFLIDITGSMSPCIQALKDNIGLFIDSLTTKNANNDSPVRDWRGRVVGYRDVLADGEYWWVDAPFVKSSEELKGQLSQLRADGGGDEPESLLDALYRVAAAGQTEKGTQTPDPYRWRYRSAAARVVIVFTDATYHPTMSIPEAQGGRLEDVLNTIMANRIILSIFAPDMACHDELAAVDRSEYEAIPLDGDSPQEALARFTGDPDNFRHTLEQLAKSVSKSAEQVEAL